MDSQKSWRRLLLVLVLVPLLPEIVVFLVSAVASVAGCKPGGEAVCAAGPVHASDFIALALLAASWIGIAFGFGLAAIWLALCCLAITRGWRRIPHRVLLAFVVCLLFAVIPYFGPMLSILHLVNPQCVPNEGGVGTCILYGGDVGDTANSVVALPWMMFLGAPIALGAFVTYAIVLAGLRHVARRRGPRPAG